ncbi:hypothetical protein ASA1KI_05150 [Opitutales bacterium ASA1]|uniref:3-methyladenine DNA glycosylase n=1 Tax=Congregicoccus parvus TaxID=3081749 RepID=UPI002B2ED6D6|nr:hypothetical protein ASA1KI_05150 [Opitutales bacterium ASA1]
MAPSVAIQGDCAQSAPDSPPEVLEFEVWSSMRAAHLARARQWTAPHRERASRGEKHPVLDFLFGYYSRRASALERWHPGIDRALADCPEARTLLTQPGYGRRSDGAVAADPKRLAAHRRESVGWIASLLRACRDRPASFGCFGLHEWAMVYRPGDDGVRHERVPLRFPPEELAAIVEQLGVRCSHFDAFRFFTPAGRPLNRLQPSREDRLALEQRGCVHVTMDLYKWAYKLEPFTPGELLLDTFELALAARDLDMRASPYDLRSLGYEPVAIETPEGRLAYEREQRALAARAEPLRERLLGVCTRVLAGAHGG